MSKRTDLITKFREELDKRLDNSIGGYTKRKEEALQKFKDDPIRLQASNSWWDNKIDTLKWAKDLAMVTESYMLSEELDTEINELKEMLHA